MSAYPTPKPKPGIMDISPYVAGKSKSSAAVQKILKLSSNENTLGPSPKALEAYAEHARMLHRYPASGSEELRAAIAEVHTLDAKKIICGAGSDELIGLLVHAYAGVGDEVLYSEHGFLMYKIYTQGAGATPVAAPEQHLTAHVDSLLAAVTPRTRIVFVANPNNPTGTYLPATEMKRLRNGLREDVILAIDGAYAEYADVHDYSDGRELVEQTKNTVMLRTFSKIYGLSSLRLGWGYFPEGIADVINRLRGPFNVSGVSQATGIAAMKDTAYVEKIKKHNATWRTWLVRELSSLGLKAYPSLANFILVDFSGAKKTSVQANQFLMERGIIVREVVNYKLPTCLRITIGTEEEMHATAAALRECMTHA